MKLLVFLFFASLIGFFGTLIWGVSTFFTSGYILTPIVSLIFLLIIPIAMYWDRKEVNRLQKKAKDSN